MRKFSQTEYMQKNTVLPYHIYIYVVVLASYTLVGPTFLLNYIMRLLWWLHKLLLSNYSPYLCYANGSPHGRHLPQP